MVYIAPSHINPGFHEETEMKNLSKAFAAIIISAMFASPALASTKHEGWYAMEDGKETPLHVTMKLPAGNDNTKNVYACYYTPDIGKSEKERWSNCGLKRDPRMPKVETAADDTSEALGPAVAVSTANDPCKGLGGEYTIRKDLKMDCPLYQNSGRCNNDFCVWVNPNEQARNAYYYPVPQPYYNPYGYYGQGYYAQSYCCYSNYNSKPLSKTGKALVVGGAAALVAGLVVH